MHEQRIRTVGVACLWAGVVGAVQAAVVSVWPEAVGTDRYSYPFSSTGFVVAQASFALQHLPLVAAVLALRRLPIVSRSRAARLGVAVAGLGMMLLTAMEVVAMSAANLATGSAHAELVDGLYGIPVTLVGIGFVVAGIALHRSEAPSWLRFVPLVLGAYVFVPMTPALMGPFVAGRAAIGGWMLVFAALGRGLAGRFARVVPKSVPATT